MRRRFLLALCLILALAPSTARAGDSPILTGVVHWSYPYYHPTEKYTLSDLQNTILPVSGARLLTNDDLAALTPEMLHLAQQEILARRGAPVEDFARFYFAYRGWYKDTGFDPKNLTTIEKANMDFLKKEEEAQNRRFAWFKKRTDAYDMDGDGKKDEVTFTVSGSNIKKATLVCGNAKLSLSTKHVDGFTVAMWIADIDESDGMREVAIASGDKGGKQVAWYRLSKGRWKEIGKMATMETDSNGKLEFRLDGKGTVWGRQRIGDGNLAAAWTAFELGKSGLKAVQDSKPRIVNMRLSLLGTEEATQEANGRPLLRTAPPDAQRKTVTLFRAPGDSSKVGTVREYDELTLLSLSLRDDGIWWEILGEDGLRGWTKSSVAKDVFETVGYRTFHDLPENTRPYPTNVFPKTLP